MGITDVSMGATFQKPFFLILNLAVGGTWPGNPDSTTPTVQTMAVDWVRVYQ
jgi:beta-glucanase (GH16 family)